MSAPEPRRAVEAAAAPPELPIPCLALVTDRHAAQGRPLDAVVAAALDGGVNLVQLREKDLPARELWSLATRLRELTAGRALFLVNDRLDVALAAGADGVHLAGHSLPPAAARALLGPDRLIGCSVHDAAQAEEAARGRPDYLFVGTLYPSRSHPGQPAAGPRLVEELRETTDVPLVGIGGITVRTAREVLMAGARGVAVISAIMAAPDPAAAAARLRDALRTVEPLRRRPPQPALAD
ncbi:MAG TPA: thiamine phosphate synthase [Chloroflexota bacterium]|nr:thiamine phosphate synthase [Chloroflexota bacterium]